MSTPAAPSARAGERRFAIALSAVALLGWLLRLAVVAWVPTQPVSDFWSYFERARSMVTAHEYAPFPGRPDAGFPPGYPLLLAAAHLLPGDALLAAKLIDSALGVATIVLAGLLGRRVGGPAAGLIAAALAAFHPRLLLMTPVLASEQLFIPLLLLFALLMSRAWQREKPWRLVAVAGLVLGLIALTRPVGYLLGAFWPLASRVAGKRWRAALAETALLLAVQHAVMLPWAIRNEMTLGRFTFLTSVGGIDLFIGNSDGATGDWYYWEPALRALEPGLDTRQVFALDDAARRQALAWMRARPGRALALYRVKVARILLGDQSYVTHYAVSGEGAPPLPSGKVLAGPHPLKEQAARVTWWLTWWSRAVFAAGAAGCAWLAVVAWRRRSRDLAALALAVGGMAAYFPLVTAVFLGSSRFAWPAADLLLAPAGFAVASLLRRTGGGRAG